MPGKPTVYRDNIPHEVVAVDADAFDDLLRDFGVSMVHYRAMKCPVGLSDPEDHRRAHDHHVNCSNGFLYRKAGVVTMLFGGNSLDGKHTDIGLIDSGQAKVTLPRFYDDPAGERIYVAYADRFFLVGPEDPAEMVLVPSWDTLRSNGTGKDRLQYQARQIKHVVDSLGKEYDPSTYEVDGDGLLSWRGSERPQAGTVITAWYLYQPHWYVARLYNEIRVTNTIDGGLDRMPQSCLLNRENIFRNAQNDPEAPDDPRKQDDDDRDETDFEV